MDMGKLLVKLDSDICLQNAASQFMVDSGHVNEYQKRGLPVPRAPRIQFWPRRRIVQFEDWLFEQGALLVRDNGRCYLRFFNEPDRTLFILKWQR